MAKHILFRDGKIVYRNGKIVFVDAGEADQCACCGGCFYKASPCPGGDEREDAVCVGLDNLYVTCGFLQELFAVSESASDSASESPPPPIAFHFTFLGYCYEVNADSPQVNTLSTTDIGLTSPSEVESCDDPLGDCCREIEDDCSTQSWFSGVSCYYSRETVMTPALTVALCSGTPADPVAAHFFSQFSSVSSSLAFWQRTPDGPTGTHSCLWRAEPQAAWIEMDDPDDPGNDVRFVAVHTFVASQQHQVGALGAIFRRVVFTWRVRIYDGDTGVLRRDLNLTNGSSGTSDCGPTDNDLADHDCCQIFSGTLYYNEGLGSKPILVVNELTYNAAGATVSDTDHDASVSGTVTEQSGSNLCCLCPRSKPRYDRSKLEDCVGTQDDYVGFTSGTDNWFLPGRTGPCACCECDDEDECAFTPLKSGHSVTVSGRNVFAESLGNPEFTSCAAVEGAGEAALRDGSDFWMENWISDETLEPAGHCRWVGEVTVHHKDSSGAVIETTEDAVLTYNGNKSFTLAVENGPQVSFGNTPGTCSGDGVAERSCECDTGTTNYACLTCSEPEPDFVIWDYSVEEGSLSLNDCQIEESPP